MYTPLTPHIYKTGVSGYIHVCLIFVQNHLLHILCLKSNEILIFQKLSFFTAEKINVLPQEKTGLWCFRPGATQTELYMHRRWLETRNSRFNCIIRVAKTKVLISFPGTAKLIAVTVKLIRAFVYA